MEDIVERLRKIKWLVNDEMRGLIEDTTAYEAADEIEKLRNSMEAAMQHAIKFWKKNGAKSDDQLGVVGLLLAHGLGLTKEKPEKDRE